jgi:hypothetical protein
MFHLPTPIAKPDRPDTTAKAIIRLDELDTEVKLYLFTDMLAPKEQVYSGFAWTAGDLTCPPAPGQGPGGDRHFDGRARLAAEVRAVLEDGGWPHGASFGGGIVTVRANPGHGTGAATAAFAGPETLLAAVEDAFAAAGWVLIGTAKPSTLPGFFVAAPAQLGAAAGDGEVRDLLRHVAEAITNTLG